MSIVYVGAALLANTGWPLVLLPIVLVTLFFVAVRREERYLSQAFGSQYEQYRTRVRRWL